MDLLPSGFVTIRRTTDSPGLIIPTLPAMYCYRYTATEVADVVGTVNNLLGARYAEVKVGTNASGSIPILPELTARFAEVVAEQLLVGEEAHYASRRFAMSVYHRSTAGLEDIVFPSTKQQESGRNDPTSLVINDETILLPSTMFSSSSRNTTGLHVLIFSNAKYFQSRVTDALDNDDPFIDDAEVISAIAEQTVLSSVVLGTADTTADTTAAPSQSASNKINSRVIAVAATVVASGTTFPDGETLLLTFGRRLQDLRLDADMCVYWDLAGSAWLQSGCFLDEGEARQPACKNVLPFRRQVECTEFVLCCTS